LSAINDDLAAIIREGAEAIGTPLPCGATAAFQRYYEILEERGKNVNLTAVVGAADVARLHFLDSIALLNIAEFKNARVIDIGSGAGFPGIPLKISEPSVDLTLLDSLGKRTEFLSELCAALDLDAACIQARAEVFAREAENRDNWDIAVSRAVAKLNILSELCLPLVRVGGIFVAMKGKDSENELAEAQHAFKVLGAKLKTCIDYAIPGTEITHRAIVIEKVAETSPKYPRRYARIHKSPL